MKTRSDIRNVAIIAHVDHGKTTLVDAMLKQSGVFREGQQVATRVLDSNPLERERGITILAKNTAVRHGDVKFNIVDTPGHSDFGGEVERVLQMVQGVLLLVDAAEGVMPQTRFVLRKALELDLRAIVVINKIDRKDARPQEVVNETFDLFVELGANDEQADFPVIFTNAKAGIAKRALDEDERLARAALRDDRRARSRSALRRGAVSNARSRRSITTATSAASASGASFAAASRRNDPIVKIARDGIVAAGLRLTTLLDFAGLERIDVEEAVGRRHRLRLGNRRPQHRRHDRRCQRCPRRFTPSRSTSRRSRCSSSVNNSPFAGREGKFLTSRQIRERSDARAGIKRRPARRAKPATADTFEVRGRGELHLAILIETMRREGYELAVSKPQVIVTERDGERWEPVEYVVVDVPEEYSGRGNRGARAAQGGDVEHALRRRRAASGIHDADARDLRSARRAADADPRHRGPVAHLLRPQPWQGELPGRGVGALVASETGRTTGYALTGLEQRGRFFVGPGVDVYEGMIVGRANDDRDVALNVVREKKLTNMRAAGSDENLKLAPPEELSLERAIEFIDDDELVEVTPESIRLRKRLLHETDRLRQRKREASRV